MRSNPQFRRERVVPDYSRRRVQVRLALLVFSVMTVLAMMQKAGNPETWAWMNFGDRQLQPELRSKPIDTRYAEVEGDSGIPTDVISIAPSESKRERTEDSEAGVETVNPNEGPSGVIERDEEETENDEQNATPPVVERVELGDDFEIAERDFWEKAYDEFNQRDKDILFHIVRAARHGETPRNSLASDWPALADHINERRQKYYTQILSRVESLEESRAAEKTRWLNTLGHMRTFWDLGLLPKLAVVAKQDSEKPSPDINSLSPSYVLMLHETIDSIALSLVEDNAMTSSRTDMQAWFGILDRLQRNSAENIKEASTGSVSYVQLFQQPDQYRGKIVTIVGRVRGAYWVDAPKNELGINRYYVFWIRPEDGSNNPIAVYTLNAPPGFPNISRQHEDSDKEEWDEPVFVFGVFFKKWVYKSQESSRVCPLLIAKTLAWNPAPPAQVEAKLPEIPVIIAMIIAIGLVAVAIAAFAFHLSSRELPGSRFMRNTDAASFEVEKIVDYSSASHSNATPVN